MVPPDEIGKITREFYGRQLRSPFLGDAEMTKIRSFSGALAAGVLGSLLWVGSAAGQLITIELQQNGGPIQTFTNGGAGEASTPQGGTTVGNFRVGVSAAGQNTGPNAGTL